MSSGPLSRRLVAVSLGALLATATAQAASTGTTNLFTAQGGDAGTPNGDYLSDDGGLATFYRFFIEVPPGLGRLTVEVFDADVGEGGGTEDTAGRDRDRDDGYDTQVDYTLIRPDGSTAATLSNCDDNTCNDNAWDVILNSTTAQNTAAGHWELRVDMDAANDINAFGVRAHDGTSDSGGTELNVYADTQYPLGVNPSSGGANSRSYTLYPYLTSGCSAAKNDFDYDSNSGSVGSMAFTDRTGSFVQNYATGSLSSNNAWRRDTFSGWTTDQLAVGQGIWTGAFTISTYNNPGVNGNYTVVYLSNFQAAANPPGANPVTNGFRTYLPNDAGTAPSKPYVEQLLTHKSGVNPVGAGQTSRYQVTVRVVNPGAQAITFSASNLVRTNVPGSGVVYAGNAAVTQGSITAQPSVGGTGNITWNPGTVAAGATVLLTYQVDVSPTSSGQRLPVTATPASGNGTRAQYVDNTGNTTQTRATYLFGPLCELAVTAGQLTPAVVSAFGVQPARGGGLVVEWSTASEQLTSAFRLLRRDRAAQRWAPVHEGWLPALVGTDQGGRYRLLDAAVGTRQGQVYLLEERDPTGRLRRHGPFRVPPPAANAELVDEPANGYERAVHASPRRSPAASASSAARVVAAPSRPDKNVDALRLGVRGSGLVRVTLGELAAASGMPSQQLEQKLRKGKLGISREGHSIAWRPELTADGSVVAVLFYAAPFESLFSLEAAYRLAFKDAPLVMASAAALPPGSSDVASVQGSVHAETDAFPATALPLDPASDYWFWEFLEGDDPTFGTRTFPLAVPAVTAGDAVLHVELQGATDQSVAGEHEVEVRLNGSTLGTLSWSGIAPQQGSFAAGAALLPSGNQVELVARVGGGAPLSIVYVQSLALEYRRQPLAQDDALAFPGEPDGGTVAVGGFSAVPVALLDITDARRPVWLEGATTTADGLRFATLPQAQYLAVGGGGHLTVAGGDVSIRPWQEVRRIGKDYLVVAPPALLAGAEQLAAHRQAQGLAAAAVDLDAVADTFGHGIASPDALRRFIAAAHVASGRRLRYVALAGDGSVDYRDLLGFGEGLVPTLMARTANGLFPADLRLGDVDGDGVPEVAVGRIPVGDAGQLAAWIDKIAAYEGAGTPAWGGRVVIASDAADGSTSFAGDSERLASQLPGDFTVSRIDLGSETIADARARLLGSGGELDTGVALLTYLGHGGLDRLAAGGLLTDADVPALGNGTRLPVVAALTCVVNRFSVPGVPALGELLVRQSTGGAAAVLAGSGLAEHDQSLRLGEAFVRAVARGERTRTGDALLEALLFHLLRGGDPGVVDLYNLLGDPATPLVGAPETPPSGGGTVGE